MNIGVFSVSTTTFARALAQFKYRDAIVAYTAKSSGPLSILKESLTGVALNHQRLACADADYTSELVGEVALNSQSPDYQTENSADIRLLEAMCRERLEVNSSFSDYELQLTVDRLLNIAESLIFGFSLTHIVFQEPPHAMYDFALYLVAKKHGCKTLVFYNTHIQYNSFISDDIFAPKPLAIDYARVPLMGEVKRREAFTKASSQFISPGYMRNVVTPASTRRKLLGAPVKAAARVAFPKRYGGYLKARDVHLWQRQVPRVRDQLIEYSRDYAAHRFISKRTTSSVSRPYILVPLPLQRERTTMPQARFAYQVSRYILPLLAAVSGEYTVVCRENPKQFGHSVATGSSRQSIEFYRDLLDAGCTFVDPAQPIGGLISEAAAVVVANGTAGFESVVNFQKPAFLAASAWYDSLPGVTRLREAVDFQRIPEVVQSHSNPGWTAGIKGCLGDLNEMLFTADGLLPGKLSDQDGPAYSSANAASILAAVIEQT